MRQILLLLIVTASLFGAAKKNFSIDNLKTIPSYERYEFQATSTKYDDMPVIMEYERPNDSIWETRGSMVIEDKKIKERYLIRTKNLLITEYWRDLYNPRGSTKNHSIIDVDTETDDPEEFIISNIPGLLYILRTFPFDEEIDKLIVRAPSQKKGHLNLRVKNKGLKTMNIPAFGEVEIYHIEVSLMVPVVGGFIPKLNYYFRNDAQKTLVAMKGLMPGSGNKIDIQLKSYKMIE